MAGKQPHKVPDVDSEFPVIMEAAIENGLTPEEAMFLVAMRMTEQGPDGYEYGVKISKGTNLRTQAGQAAASIVKNRQRYDKYVRSGGVPNYTKFFAHHGGPVGSGWAPITDVPESESGLNSNWPKNQDHFLSQMLPTWMPRIKEWYDTSDQQKLLKQDNSPIK